MASLGGGYSPVLGGSAARSGQLASTTPTTVSRHVNAVPASAGSDTLIVHLALAVVVVAVIILMIGRGYLRNARIA